MLFLLTALSVSQKLPCCHVFCSAVFTSCPSSSCCPDRNWSASNHLRRTSPPLCLSSFSVSSPLLISFISVLTSNLSLLLASPVCPSSTLCLSPSHPLSVSFFNLLSVSTPVFLSSYHFLSVSPPLTSCLSPPLTSSLSVSPLAPLSCRKRLWNVSLMGLQR